MCDNDALCNVRHDIQVRVCTSLMYQFSSNGTVYPALAAPGRFPGEHGVIPKFS